MSPHQMSWSRRRFLQTTAAAGLAMPTFVAASALGREGRPAASERIAVGIVGLGSRGFNHLDEFAKEPTAQIVAVCDVDTLHYRDNPWEKGRACGMKPAMAAVEKRYAKNAAKSQGCRGYHDFRELCTSKDIDAVVIATPDHWHATCSIFAMGQGKDIYCEKPLTHFFAEGQRVYQEVAKRKAVFQAGSQQRSDTRFQRAVELVRNGCLGKIKNVEVGLPTGYDKAQGDATVENPPDHLDYEFWTGPAPMLPYMRARSHRWWRGHRAYGGGTLMDWIGHHNDIAQWALGMDESGPSSVKVTTWELPNIEIYNTPVNYEILCEYPGGTISSISNHHPNGIKWIGEKSWLFVTRGKWQASEKSWLQTDFDPGPFKIPRLNSRHARNFLDCVKSRERCIAPAEIAHRSITPGHLAYVAQAVGRVLRWDAQAEKIIGDDEADKLLRQQSHRQPWNQIASF